MDGAVPKLPRSGFVHVADIKTSPARSSHRFTVGASAPFPTPALIFSKPVASTIPPGGKVEYRLTHKAKSPIVWSKKSDFLSGGQFFLDI